MTKRRYDNRDTSFGRWVRNNQRLQSKLGYDIQDFDDVFPNDFEPDSAKHKVYINHQFLYGKLMLIEEKQHKATRTLSQKDTFGIIDQWCRHASNIEVERMIEGRPANVEYWGMFVLQFEGFGPEDGRIWINGKKATLKDLEELLLFSPARRSKFRQS